MADRKVLRLGIQRILQAHGMTASQANKTIDVVREGYRQGLRGKKLQAYIQANVPGAIDWSAILKLIMQILPLILALFGM